MQVEKISSTWSAHRPEIRQELPLFCKGYFLCVCVAACVWPCKQAGYAMLFLVLFAFNQKLRTWIKNLPLNSIWTSFTFDTSKSYIPLNYKHTNAYIQCVIAQTICRPSWQIIWKAVGLRQSLLQRLFPPQTLLPPGCCPRLDRCPQIS